MFPTRTDTNQAVDSQKMVRGLGFRIKIEEGLYYRCIENKGADPAAQLLCSCSASLFSLMQKAGFLIVRL